MPKIAGVVVTYNRKEELIKNIRALQTQTRKLDRIFIVDNNSTDGTFEFLEDNGVFDDKSIEIVRLSSNIGGAGGFYEGIKVAFEQKYDFIVLMDDDGRPAKDNTIEKLHDKADELYGNYKKMMINSIVVYDEQQEKLSFGFGDIVTADAVAALSKDGLYEGYINPFNGTLITKELVEEIGYPNKDFFIRGDEVDYQYRAKKSGAFIATVCSSVYYHPTMELVPVKWRGREIKVSKCPGWKAYYLMRNYIYRIKRDEGLVNAIKEFIFQTVTTRKANCSEKNITKFLIKGFRDGISGRLGMTVKPGAKDI